MWNLDRIGINLRSSLWFIPAICVVFALALAVAMVEIDLLFSQREQHEWPRFFAANPEGARGILEAVATSTITVAGVIFSIVIVALSIASNQYTPRILRTFMRDRGTQLVLGVFVGVFTYSLIVLRTIRAGEHPFVPAVATNLAIVLALVSIGFLVYFIHHIASSIQAPTMIAGISEETVRALEKLFPEEPSKEETMELEHDDDWVEFKSVGTGYLQNVDRDLIRLAGEHDLVVRVERKMGEFVIRGTPLLSIRSKSAYPANLKKKLLRCIALDSFRTVDQDPSYGIQQLVDIALKALSPGVNDTSTAVNCVDYLGSILFSLVQREPMPRELRCEGKVRVIHRKCLDMERLTDGALLQIRQSAKGNPAVLLRLLKTVGTALEVAKRAEYKAVLAKHVSLIQEVAAQSIVSAEDLKVVLSRVEKVRALVRGVE